MASHENYNESESAKLIHPLNIEKSDTPPAPKQENTEKDEKGFVLIVAFLLMLIFQLGNRIFGRLLTYPMHNYAMFMNLMSSCIYVPLCFVYIFPTLLFTDKISREQREIPKYKFAIMGGYDSIAGMMQTFAVNYITSASTMVLVQQSAIPISMLISKITLNSTYSKAQYTGAGVVLLGIVAVLIPTFFASSPTPTSESQTESSSFQLIWILLLVASCVPMCLSSVYKEKALGETEIDIVYLNGWVAVFQTVLAVPLCIPSAALIGLSAGEIIPNLIGGTKCFMGINSITESNNPLNKPLDDCVDGPFFVLAYLFFNIGFNFLIIIILQHGSANILYMAGTVIVPLSNVAFSLKFMPGSKPLQSIDILGLFIIMLGLLIYRFTPQLLAQWNRLTGKIVDFEELEAEQIASDIAHEAEKKQVKYFGLNQMDALETFVDTRVKKEQRRLVPRSPGQIRGKLLYKLGIPPSPHISFGRGGSPALGSSYQQQSNLPLQSTGLSPRIALRGSPSVSSTKSVFNKKPASKTSKYGTSSEV